MFTSGVTELLFSFLVVRIKATNKVDITIRDATNMKATTPITVYRSGRTNNTFCKSAQPGSIVTTDDYCTVVETYDVFRVSLARVSLRINLIICLPSHSGFYKSVDFASIFYLIHL